MESITRQEIKELQYHWEDNDISPTPTEDEKISVSAATRRIAHTYERFRNILEPEEEDILRRNAIYRILDRRLEQDRAPGVIATALLQELVRAHYIQPPSKQYVKQVAGDIRKARAVIASLTRPHDDWFLHLVAVSIDRKFHSHQKQIALAQLMYQDTYKRAAWSDDMVDEKDRPTQLYNAAYRVLFSVDDHELAYAYFLKRFPAWQDSNASDSQLYEISQNIPSFYEKNQAIIHHPAQYRLQRLIKPAAVPYRIVWDILKKKDESVFADLDSLKKATSEALDKRMRSVRSRMSRRAWHSILFLFATKLFLTLIIELPYELFVLSKVHWLALGTNIAFHPLLLFFTSTWTRLPGQRNAEKVSEHVEKVVTGEGELPTIILSYPRRYGAITWSVFAMTYALLFLFIFWGLFIILDRLEFSLVAMFLFVIFLGLVSFLSYRIRRSVDEVRILPGREGALSTIISFIALPILEFGRWLAQNIQQLNVVLFIMDRILEAPFKLLIDVIEDWFSFVKERKEEIL